MSALQRPSQHLLIRFATPISLSASLHVSTSSKTNIQRKVHEAVCSSRPVRPLPDRSYRLETVCYVVVRMQDMPCSGVFVLTYADEQVCITRCRSAREKSIATFVLKVERGERIYYKLQIYPLDDPVQVCGACLSCRCGVSTGESVSRIPRQRTTALYRLCCSSLIPTNFQLGSLPFFRGFFFIGSVLSGNPSFEASAFSASVLSDYPSLVEAISC